MEYEYQFPEKNPFRAKEVTEPEFHIQEREDWFKNLWIDFSPARSNRQFDKMTYALGMVDGKVENRANDYEKFIFSGHRGCGKSVELRRFAQSIDGPDNFVAIFIDLELETDVEQLSAEDIFVVLITILARELKKRKIPFDQSDFDHIASEWLSEEEVQKELTADFGMEATAEVSIGAKFWQFLGLEGHLKGTYARQNKTTRSIREKIKANPKSLITKLNALLVRVRQEIRKGGFGQDIVFLIDGLEKARENFYKSLFIYDPSLITGIEAHLISTVPISTFYEISDTTSLDFFKTFYLPMLRVDKKSDSKSISLLKKLIYRRVDRELLEEKVLDEFIKFSGGCPRILLKLVNRGFLQALGKNITPEIADEVIREEGQERWRALTQTHRDILKAGHFEAADKVVLELLQSLNILEYNGASPERKVNPLLLRFLKPEK